jgi:hypothetical protein
LGEGGEKVASDEEIRRLIEEIEKIRRQVRNSKLKVKRRIKRLEKTFDLMERHRIEFEIELLKRKIRRWEVVETKLSIPIMKATLFGGKSEYKIDWSKAGRA